MDILELLALISKIHKEAPVLLPDALKLMEDLETVMKDFRKLVSDFDDATTNVPAPTE